MLCPTRTFKTYFTALLTMRSEESLFCLNLLRIYLFWCLSWCLIKDLKCVQLDLKIMVNFAIALVIYQKLLVAKCSTQKHRVYHTKLFPYGFFPVCLSYLSQCRCRRGCSRANLPPACLIRWGGTTFRGWKQLRQLTWVPVNINCCHHSLIWTPAHWEPAQDLQTNLTETNE